MRCMGRSMMATRPMATSGLDSGRYERNPLLDTKLLSSDDQRSAVWRSSYQTEVLAT